MTSFASSSSSELSRREAIRRSALFLGVAALSPSLITGALHAQDGRAPGPKTASGFSPKQLETVSAVAERIIPKTDTPGAIDVGVPAFIQLMYSEYMTEAERNVLSDGLVDVEKRSAGAHKKAFSKVSSEQQDALLRKIAEESQDKQRTFFHLMREVTVLGYFTSERVGKTVLHYDPVPGRFDPCVPISEVGNVNWTR